MPHPKLIRSLRNVTAVVSAFFHALAITSDGALWSWGDDQGKFSLGHGDNHVSEGVELLPRRIGSLSGKPILSVAAGLWHSLAVGVDGGCYSWGTNSYGQLGQEGPERETPTRIDALRGICVSSVAAFEMLSCAVSSLGEIWKWGEDTARVPTRLTGTALDSHSVVSVSFCGAHCLALTSYGSVFRYS